MKGSKAADPSGIIAEMLKAAGEDGVELARQLVQAVFSSGEIPADWKESYILKLYRGKGEAPNRSTLPLLNFRKPLIMCWRRSHSAQARVPDGTIDFV